MDLLILAEVLAITILPVTLIKLNIIRSDFRFFVLAGIVLCSFFLVNVHNISLSELGIRLDNIYPGIYVYAIATIIAVLFLILLAKIMKKKKARGWYKDPHFLFFFIPISFAQQFLFQGFILQRLGEVFIPFIAILINALLFGYMHTIYPKPVFSMLLGVAAGIFFGTLYTAFPNLVISSIVHAILNFTAVYFSFFTFLDSDEIPRRTELNPLRKA